MSYDVTQSAEPTPMSCLKYPRSNKGPATSAMRKNRQSCVDPTQEIVEDDSIR